MTQDKLLQSANSKERDPRGRDVPPSKQDRSSCSRTFASQPAVSVRAALTKDDDEPGLDDGGDDNDNDNDNDNDDKVLENRKPRGRGWSDLEEQRLRAYRKLGKEWLWIASKIGRTEGAVKQHWGIMETRAKAAREITKKRATAASGVMEKRRAKASG